ncbi:MAG: hypothetical protein ACOYKQ_13585 [Polymorphobacter sp.]
MVMAPALAVIASTVVIGIYMGWRYLRGERNNRVLVGFHLVLGVIGLEVTAMVIRGAPSGERALGALGPLAAVLTAVTLLSGLLVPLIAQPRPKLAGPALAAHAAVGAVAFVLYLVWAIPV